MAWSPAPSTIGLSIAVAWVASRRAATAAGGAPATTSAGTETPLSPRSVP